MDLHPVVKNGKSGSWIVRPRIEVAITLLREYYAGRGVVIRFTNIDPLLVLVSVIEVSDALDMLIPFSIHDVTRLSQCAGMDIIWKAEYLVLYAEAEDAIGIGYQLTPCLQGHSPHNPHLL